jgi:threonine/homoserine/homoserine lactone efflux protein
VFWKGALLGCSIAAPVGPIGILCIRRSLGQGFLAGFASGLGAATADALNGAVAGLGPPNAFAWINRASGLVLGAFGALALAAAWAS